MRTAEDPVIRLALKVGLLTPTQLAAAEARRESSPEPAGQKPRLLEFLVQDGVLEAARVARLLADQHGLPLVDLRSVSVPADVLAMLPRASAERYNVLPLARERAALRVAIGDPLDFDAIDEIGHVTGSALLHPPCCTPFTKHR